jgi:hypothetical protein
MREREPRAFERQALSTARWIASWQGALSSWTPLEQTARQNVCDTTPGALVETTEGIFPDDAENFPIETVAQLCERIVRVSMRSRRVNVSDGRESCEAEKKMGLLGRRLCHVPRRAHGAISPSCLATGTADGCHVVAVTADDFATLAARVTRLVGREFVRAALRVSRLPALAGDLALLGQIHRSESSVALGTLGTGLGRHVVASPSGGRPPCSACARWKGAIGTLE